MKDLQVYKKAQVGNAIDINQQYENALLKVVLELGIKQSPGELKTQIGKFLEVRPKYFKNVAPNHITEAFELYQVGLLDNYEPRQHYNSFSLQFVSSVLNCYLQFKKDEVVKKRPKDAEGLQFQTSISEKEKNDLDNSFIKEIIAQFDIFLEGQEPVFRSTGIAHMELCKVELLKGEIKPTQEAIDMCIFRINKSVGHRYEIRNQLEKVGELAKVDQKYLDILNLFKLLKEKGKHVKQFFNS